MKPPVDIYIHEQLQKRKSQNNYRSLQSDSDLIDFTSNDYLGLARNPVFFDDVKNELDSFSLSKVGSTGSRLLSGNNQFVTDLENDIARWHNSENAILFNTGFTANYGLLSTLPYKGQTVFYDENVHASIHDGIRASKAESAAFKHNDLSHLESLLKNTSGLKYVITESLFSMEGDFAPLRELFLLTKKYDAGLIVDEAHAMGIYGKEGLGCWPADCEPPLARVCTYGKAFGAQGAVILCSTELKEFLINYCRPLIYSTAPMYYQLAAIKCAYMFIINAEPERKELFEKISLFKRKMCESASNQLLPSDSPIQSLIIPGNENVKRAATLIRSSGFDVRPILSPTVPKGTERIRICLHSFNTKDEILNLTRAIHQL